MEHVPFNYSSKLNGQFLNCKIECDLEDVEYAFYIQFENKKIIKYWYSSQASIAHDCTDEIVHNYEVTYFVREKNGNIFNVTEDKRSIWSLCDGAIEAIKQLSMPETNTLEFGSGYGSVLLSKYTNIYSIEHDKSFVGLFNGVNYIHAPLQQISPLPGFDENYWYDSKIVENNLPENCDLVIVDGPPEKYGRSGILHHLDLFSEDTVWIVDDVLREKDQRLANYIALHFSLIQYRFWNFSILAKEPLGHKNLMQINLASLQAKKQVSVEYLEEFYPSVGI